MAGAHMEEHVAAPQQHANSRYVVYVNASDTMPDRHGRRLRVVVGAMMAVGAAVFLVSAAHERNYVSVSALSQSTLGMAAQQQRDHELKVLKEAGRSVLNEATSTQDLTSAPTSTLSWTNAGAQPDSNVFAHGDDWKPADDPSKPDLKAADRPALTAGTGPRVFHATDAGSSEAEGFVIDRSSDDAIHREGALTMPEKPKSIVIPSSGRGPTVHTGTDSGAEGESFKIDTSIDDYLHTGAPPDADKED